MKPLAGQQYAYREVRGSEPALYGIVNRIGEHLEDKRFIILFVVDNTFYGLTEPCQQGLSASGRDPIPRYYRACEQTTCYKVGRKQTTMCLHLRTTWRQLYRQIPENVFFGGDGRVLVIRSYKYSQNVREYFYPLFKLNNKSTQMKFIIEFSTLTMANKLVAEHLTLY